MTCPSLLYDSNDKPEAFPSMSLPFPWPFGMDSCVVHLCSLNVSMKNLQELSQHEVDGISFFCLGHCNASRRRCKGAASGTHQVHVARLPRYLSCSFLSITRSWGEHPFLTALCVCVLMRLPVNAIASPATALTSAASAVSAFSVVQMLSLADTITLVSRRVLHCDLDETNHSSEIFEAFELYLLQQFGTGRSKVFNLWQPVPATQLRPNVCEVSPIGLRSSTISYEQMPEDKRCHGIQKGTDS